MASIPETLNSGRAESAPARTLWARLFDIRISFIPLPIYVALCALVAGIVAVNKVGVDLPTMVAIIGLGGAACGEIGKRIPYLRRIGGSAIIAAFLPAYLMSIGWVPDSVATSITTFTKSSNFIYLFVSAVVVGSIFTMDRDMIIKGFAKIFLPMVVGSVLAFVAGGLVGMAAGMDLKQVLFFVSVPVMGGGLGEGAIPLSVGYAEIMGVDSGKVLAQLLPIILLGNLCAIVLCGVMSAVGRRFPHLTGNGQLYVGEEIVSKPAEPEVEAPISVEWAIAAGMCAITLYLSGVLMHELFNLPGPVCMLFLAVLMKLFKLVPKALEDGSRTLFKFFTTSVTYPLLFANSIAVTHWSELMAAFHVGNLLAIFTTVLVLIVVGFVMARRLGLHPVETAIVNGCHSGLGGTGDVAILTAAGRMELMPFAQISTRIGGAITVMIALLIFAQVGP
ncbi:2-hydroxycarboxylate transporter family protein [Pseudomonas syringae pv. dysoxyli]|uniref:2-hydroxycarboxylate transporter family protein n=1 Tax=Pseudomonas syringae TaxID=317 RepID=UPI001372B760|nr:2-hydroxycarboxylate transporter family protein [Pseudomonas syringae]NAO28812.1 2-hydroxycarboxylate transporter family protein [Pseudomonas syringae pv. dysoxyli]